jgi:hypothetical protein
MGRDALARLYLIDQPVFISKRSRLRLGFAVLSNVRLFLQPGSGEEHALKSIFTRNNIKASNSRDLKHTFGRR